jgi:hypothetical protein
MLIKLAKHLSSTTFFCWDTYLQLDCVHAILTHFEYCENQRKAAFIILKQTGGLLEKLYTSRINP